MFPSFDWAFYYNYKHNYRREVLIRRVADKTLGLSADDGDPCVSASSSFGLVRNDRKAWETPSAFSGLRANCQGTVPERIAMKRDICGEYLGTAYQMFISGLS
jgi:hypothetical protein